MDENHIVELTFRVTNSKGVITAEIPLTLRDMKLDDVVKLEKRVLDAVGGGLAEQIASIK